MHFNVRKISEAYKLSAGILLVMFALAIVLMIIAGTGYLHPYDLALGISIHVILGTVAIASLLVACCCFFSQNHRTPVLLILWLTVNFYIYLLCLHYSGCNTLAGFFGDSIYCFGVSPEIANNLIFYGAIYLTVGSCITYLIAILSKPVIDTTLKISCPACGGHIKFAIQNIGLKVPCPHCQAGVILRRDKNLKMSCFFCNEHIEFPAHALGTKMACPHCKMDITLKEPA